MNNNLRARVQIALGLAVLILCCSAVLAAKKNKKNKFPSFAEVKTALKKHVTALPNYRSGDMLRRSQVESFFKKLARLGWKIDSAEQAALLRRVPADGGFLAQQYSTKQGRAFMRKAGGYAGGFDRLDQLASISKGQQTIRDLVNGPDGYKMIEYLTTSKGGKNMSKMLSKVPGGKGFGKPTGKIYTARQLLDELQSIYKKPQQ